MRFKSEVVDGYQVFAVTGVNTISFALDAAAADTNGLLGFAVERTDLRKNEKYFMPGFKVFASVIPQPDKNTHVSTYEHPIQSFVWDDFTLAPNHEYRYAFFPLKGTPKNLDRRAAPIVISVHTEPLFSDQEHDVFFNRGVASSQAYARRFGNRRPDQLPPPKKKAALQWLSRELDEALLKFIANTRPGDTLLCCFYEFRYLPVAQALKQALDRNVTLRIIIDAKVNEKNNKDGSVQESFPREDNLRIVKKVKIPLKNVIQRKAKPNEIQHNKFMVLLKGSTQQPAEVWTGSTNISEGGLFGQTNVGHWVRNADLAQRFVDYWNLLSKDPGPKDGDDRTTVRNKNQEFRNSIEALGAVPQSMDQIQTGITPVFSPRNGLSVLELYATMVDQAENHACITLAFGINKVFKERLKDNSTASAIAFFLLEKKDKPNPRSKQKFIEVNARNNVYKAWGSYLREPLHQWARETSAFGLGINMHVAFIHSKFLARDPLSADPIVVTGSANFSDASTNTNDENMLIIRGNLRVADIYFTEFNRLFNHYYFRSVIEDLSSSETKPPNPDQGASMFLAESDTWLSKYKPGSLRRKRVQILKDMKGIV